MNNYGRRLKRYLFLLKKKLDLYGGVEEIYPDRVTGWLYSKTIPLDEIKLYFGQHLISKSSINLERNDVSKKYNCDKNCGFNIIIPQEMPKIDPKQEIRLIATSNIKLKNFEIKCINKNTNFKQVIKDILNSLIRGSKGHFDGLNNDFYYEGWAAKSDNQEILSVWIQCNGKEPIEIKCATYRNDLDKTNVKPNSGFSINLKEIPIDWEGHKIWCSFDKKGVYKLPQLEDIKVENPKPKNITNLEIKEKQNNLVNIVEEIPTNFEEHWKALEEFNLQLNDIENSLNESHMELLPNNKNNRKSILTRIFKN